VISEDTVLAVDDEPANRRAVCRTLGDDCRVLTAGSGDEALATMACEPVALVIADQRMPGMSGSEFLAETVERYPAVVRVVLTGYTDVDTVLDAINRNHVYHFLGKPWQPRELRQVVRRGLERFSAERERARLLDELRAACARAQREADHKSRLLTLTAHELGTPLHILLNVMALLHDAELPAAARGWIDAGARAVEWLARGVAQMRDAARLREQRFPLRMQAVELTPLLGAAVAETCAAARGRALDIALEPCVERLAVRGDPHWLRQALDGLLSNAVRFTPDGGRVRVRARPDGTAVEIAVADTGIGIAPGDLVEAFEPFSSTGGDLLLHGSGRMAFGARGLGLGLAMVKGIVEAHGGTVRAESTPGAGSRFTLRLPAATDGERSRFLGSAAHS
jgi:signal transduction histidine kinase